MWGEQIGQYGVGCAGVPSPVWRGAVPASQKKRTFPFEMACLAHFERAGVEIALMKQRDDLMRVMKLRVMVILGLPIVQVIETAYKSLI